jgi:hypothetical protein
MKDLAVYYFSILLPLPLLILTAKANMTVLFVVLLFSYVIYRGFTDSRRLLVKGVIDKKDVWKIHFIPFYTGSFIKELYFEK